MDRQLFAVQKFPVEGATKCACIIAGYRGKISSYKGVIRTLNDRGYSVVAYEHDPAVLTEGKPELLPVLIRQICSDFAEQSARYKEVICVGASIGAGLCFAVQRENPKVRFGIYAGAGASPPQTVFEAPLFYFVRRKFIENGFAKAELEEKWAEVEILPERSFGTAPFIIALGKMDAVVRYEKALSTLQAWQQDGQDIRIISKQALGHVGIIRWYKSHFAELLTEAEKLNV
jgi:hypothetical protein